MSKTTLKEIVESRYSTYKEHIKAYDSVDKESIIEKLKPLIEATDSKSEDFRKIAIEVVKMDNLYPQEISRHEVKFYEAVSIYLLTEEEELSAEILTEYNLLHQSFPKDQVAIDKGKLIQVNKDLYSNLPDDIWEGLMKDIEQKLG